MSVFNKQNNFFENSKSEHERKINLLNFSVEYDFDYITEKEEVVNFLLSKNYDLSKKMKVNLSNEIKTLNEIFSICFEKFSKKIDVVELFDVITRFYNLQESICFSRLTRNNKSILLKGISKRIGETKFNKLFEDSLKKSVDLAIQNDGESMNVVFGI